MFLPVDEHVLIPPADATNTSEDDRPTGTPNDSRKAVKSASSLQNEPALTTTEKQSSYDIQAEPENPKLHSSLKENAKAAILSLLPHKIMYNDLLAEGIDPHILQQLYTELGLSWKRTDTRLEMSVANKDPRSKIGFENPLDPIGFVPSNDSLQISAQIAAENPSAKLLSGGSSLTRTTPVVNPGLERKDRIAQLLAAKTGKIGTASNVPQPGSPASVSESTIAQPPLSRKSTPAGEGSANTTNDPSKRVKTIPQTELVRQKMEQLRKEAAEKLRVAEAAIAASAPVAKTVQTVPIPAEELVQSRVTTLPTPVRESLAREGFSSMIPGLFMNSADEEVSNEDAVMMNSNSSDVRLPRGSDHDQHDSHSHSRSGTSNGLKRAAVDNPIEEISRVVKRVASSRAESIDIEMDIDEAGETAVSEGEIIDDDELAADEPADQGDSAAHQAIRQNKAGYLEQAVSVPTSSFQVGRSLRQSSPSSIDSRKIDSFQQLENITNLDMEQHKGSNLTASRTNYSINSSPITASTTQLPQKISMPSSVNTPVNDATGPSERALISPKPLVKLTPTDYAERAAQLKADFMRQRALRQKQLVEGMPVLNDEVVKTQNRLEQHRSRLSDIRRDIENYEASVTRAREAEEQILGEIAHLEKQLQDGVSGQKQFSKELSEIKQQQENDLSASPKAPTTLKSTQAQRIPSAEALKQPAGQETRSATVQSSSHYDSNRTESSISNLPQESIQHDNPVSTDMSHETSELTQPRTGADGSLTASDRSFMDEQSDHALTPNGVGEGETAAYVPDELRAHQTPINDLENAEYQSENSEDDEPMDQSEDDSEGTHMSVDRDSDGSASMSDSGSDDYEPPEPKPQSSSAVQVADVDEYEPSDGLLDPQHEEPYDAADDYEPSEVIESAASARQSSTTTPAMSSTSNKNELQSCQDETRPVISEVIQESTVDDQEKGLQLSEANLLTKPQDTADVVDPDARPLSDSESISFSRFVPYQSPLSSFKSYRFHPEFAEQIKSGYRSLTYSNKIDPKKPICPAELAGEACTDPDCEEQHFGSMALTGM